jgi:hypothetical protein
MIFVNIVMLAVAEDTYLSPTIRTSLIQSKKDGFMNTKFSIQLLTCYCSYLLKRTRHRLYHGWVSSATKYDDVPPKRNTYHYSQASSVTCYTSSFPWPPLVSRVNTAIYTQSCWLYSTNKWKIPNALATERCHSRTCENSIITIATQLIYSTTCEDQKIESP